MGNQEFTRIILGKMQEVLKPRGFRKKGNIFFAEPDEVRLVVQLQKSWLSTAEMIEACVNLGVLSRVLIRQGIGFTDDENSFKVSDYHLQTRLGMLMPSPSDYWWEVQTEQEAHTAGAQIAEALIKYGLPALEQLSSTATLRSFLERLREGDPWFGMLGHYNRERFLVGLADGVAATGLRPT